MLNRTQKQLYSEPITLISGAANKKIQSIINKYSMVTPSELLLK